MRVGFISVFLCFTASCLLAQSPDAHARKVRLKGYDLVQLADTLTAPFADDRDKVRAIFIWMTANMAYDCAGSNAHDSLAWEVEEADRLYSIRSRLRLLLKHRRALCGGYAFLFKTLCDLAEVEARVVEGKAWGGSRSSDGHAWNAVRLDGVWYWLDVTWASGGCDGGRFVRRYAEDWYLALPERMRSSHQPRAGEVE